MTISNPTDTERQLATQVALLNATLESSPDGILVVDVQGRTLLSNERFAQLWRIPAELHDSRDDERMLRHVLDQLCDPDAFLSRVQELYAQPGACGFDTLAFRDGRVFERYTQPVTAGDKAIGRIWIFRDMTRHFEMERARVELEEQLRQSQKMEAIGKLAGGVAHDFNNLLTVIMGYARLMLTRVGERDSLRANLEEIRKAGERASTLTRQLLAFSRKQLMAPRVFELNVAVQNMDRMLRHVIGEDIELETRLGENTGNVLADPGQIEQVLLNLVVNARDAMPEGGRLVIETHGVALDLPSSPAHPEMLAGEWAELSVTDSGCGMAPEVRSRIFEPFFTTKQSGQGTGLGLSTVYGIVSQSNGFVEVESQEGRGSTFRVFLPRTAADGRAPEVAKCHRQAGVGTETLLIVEDEPQVRSLAMEVLSGSGYKLLEASTPGEALALCTHHAGSIHLMVTDVIMPQLNGRELYERAAVLRPRMKVLYMSGYTGSAIEEHGVLSPETAFLQKPFSPETLAAKVRDVLDAPRHAPGGPPAPPRRDQAA